MCEKISLKRNNTVVSSMFHHIQSRLYGLTDSAKLYDAARGNTNFMQRLTLDKKLEVHSGCVNTICWNESGTKILSGSDDQYLVITNPYSGQVLHKIRSGHRSNIFSAKFLPNSNDGEIVSCSGDGKIYYTIVDHEDTHGTFLFDCHNVGTVYEVIVVQNEASTFLSCGEDGTVRFFDLRAKTSCTKYDCKEDVLISCRCAITSLSANPILPWQLAVGCSDSTVRIYDRRMLGTRASGNYTGKGIVGLMSIFTPPSLEEQSYRITSLNFSPDGEDVLVSYSSEYIYLFGTKENTKSGAEQESCDGATASDSITNNPGPSTPTDDRQPPLKRLRLRGDWSDTGPGARPESERRARASRNSTEQGEQPEEEPPPRPSIMQRMSDLLTNWLDSNLRTLPGEPAETPDIAAADNDRGGSTGTIQRVPADRAISESDSEGETLSVEASGVQQDEAKAQPSDSPGAPPNETETQSRDISGAVVTSNTVCSASRTQSGQLEGNQSDVISGTQCDGVSEMQSGETSQIQSSETVGTDSALTFRTASDAISETHSDEQANIAEGLISPVSSDTSQPDVGVEDTHLSFLHKIESMDMKDSDLMGEPSTSKGVVTPVCSGKEEMNDEQTNTQCGGSGVHVSHDAGAYFCDSIQTTSPCTVVAHSDSRIGVGKTELPNVLQSSVTSESEYDPLHPTVYARRIESQGLEECSDGQITDHFTDIRECFKEDQNKPGTSGITSTSAGCEGRTHSPETLSVGQSSLPIQCQSNESCSSSQSDASSKSPLEDRYLEDRSAIRMSMNAALESLRARNVEPVISLHYSSEGTSNSTIRLGFTSFQSLEAEIVERQSEQSAVSSGRNSGHHADEQVTARNLSDDDNDDSDDDDDDDDDSHVREPAIDADMQEHAMEQEVSETPLDLSQTDRSKMECESVDMQDVITTETVTESQFSSVSTDGAECVAANDSSKSDSCIERGSGASNDSEVPQSALANEQSSAMELGTHVSSDNTCDMLDVSSEASAGLTLVEASNSGTHDESVPDKKAEGAHADQDNTVDIEMLQSVPVSSSSVGESVTRVEEPGAETDQQRDTVAGTNDDGVNMSSYPSNSGLGDRQEDTESRDVDVAAQRAETGPAVRGRRRRVGYSGPPTGDFQLPSFSGNAQNSSSSSDEEGRDRVEDDRPRIDRTTAALRLQALHRKRQEAKEKKEIETKNIYKPTVKKKFKGHRNARTMIKEANFWGNNFVMSGSDCGHIFIWNRHTAEMVMLLEGDRHVVNCVQPHPVDTVLASSGIDYDIKIWAPLLHKPGFNEQRAQEVVLRNQVMLDETRDTITVPAAFMLRVLASINNIRSGRRAATNRSPEPEAANNSSDSD